jgi:hypothetical protein
MRTIDISDKRGLYEIILDKEGDEVKIVGAFQTHDKESIELNLRIIHRFHTQLRTHNFVVSRGRAHA